MRIARLAALAASIAVPMLVQAQSASITATATVVTPLVVTGANGLNFLNVFQGVDKSVAYTDATNGGRFSITGYQNSQVALTFTLPTTLSSGANSMPINNYAVFTNGLNSTAGATALTVVSGTAVNSNLVTGNLFLFLGARVQPAVAQAAGTYTGSITLAAAYTGL